MNWDAWKPLATLIFTSLLKFAGGLLVAHGLATNGPGLEAVGGAATTAAGAFWSWWVQKGHLAAAEYLKKLTDTATTAAAVAVAKQMAPAATTGAAQEAHQEVAIETGKIVPKAAPIVLLAVLILGALAFPGDAMAQLKTPGQIAQDIDAKIKGAKQQVANAVTPADPAAPVPCDFKMVIKLTPSNLLAAIKQCIAEKLVSDTQRALDSATAFGVTGKGDADAVNCLGPALAIFQAGVQTPAIPEVAAVLNADGSVKTPAVAAIPAQDPGPILLYQKYREFTLSGALTSCQSWFNGPINATAAAGIAGAGTLVGAAALLAPK